LEAPLGRVANLAENATPSASQKYVEYAYYGVGSILEVAHPAVTTGLNLTYGSASL
jgi:hypothetical protein